MKWQAYEDKSALKVKVIQVHCGNMVEIDRYWKIRRWTGNTIRLRGIQTPPPTTDDGKTLRNHVHQLLAGSHIEILKTYGINEFGHLICDTNCHGRPAPFMIPAEYRIPCEEEESRCPNCSECIIGTPKSSLVLPFNAEVYWYPPGIEVDFLYRKTNDH